METLRKVIRSKMVLFSLLVAVVGLMVPTMIVLAGGDDVKLEFEGERTFPTSPFFGDTLEFEVDNAGPGLSGLSGSGEFFDASAGVTEPFVITDSSVESITVPGGELRDAIILKDGLGVWRIFVQLNFPSPVGPNSVRVRYFDSSGTLKSLHDSRFNLFELELKVDTQ